MFQLKLRQAETAFKEGRLEEACQLALTPEVQEHKIGKQLTTKLVNALVDRGRRHLEGARHLEARADCQLAKRMGGNQATLGELSKLVDDAIHHIESHKRRVNELLHAADRELQRGDIGLGERVLNQLPTEDSNAVRLADRISVQKEQIDGALNKARQAAKSGGVLDAVNALSRLKKISPDHGELSGLVQQVVGPACDEIERDMNAARLDRAERSLVLLQPFATADTRLQELNRVMARASRVAGLFKAARFEDAAFELKKLETLMPRAAWISELAERSSKAVSAIRELQASPFAMLDDRDATGLFQIRDESPLHSPHLADKLPAHHSTHQRWLLQIDGVGSFLLVGSNHVSLGNSLKAKSVDVPLAGFDTGDAIISRDSGSGAGDYTLQCADQAQVNGRKYVRKLLVSGDTLEFGRRCRLRFELPNAAAPSAVLHLTGTKLSRPDVRHVILLDQSLVIGGPNGHVEAGDLVEPLILFQDCGEFWIRQGIRRVRGETDSRQRLGMNEPVELAGSRICLSPCESF